MTNRSKDINFIPLAIAILTISDTRTEENDTSGQALVLRLTKAGHHLAHKKIVKDNIYHIRAVVSTWIAEPEIAVILVTGGTGLTGRDNTPEAIGILLDKRIDGFGEVFRALSFEEIGTSTLQSRALAGVANGTFVFCMPGSTGACRTAWDRILAPQLDRRTQPCNIVELMPRMQEK